MSVRNSFALLSILLHAAIFGFFYAWICSTIWGLNTLPASDAIAAMQAMNASVRNGVFAPAFFGTPLVSALTAILFYMAQEKRAALLFAAAALIYALGGAALTFNIHVPMNEALAQLPATLPPAEADAAWASYTSDWEYWNIVRTIFSGLALICATLALIQPQTAHKTH